MKAHGSTWIAPVLLTLPALAVQLAPGAAERLQYDRERLAAGELWRILTCHFTHWSADHLLWDLAATAMLAAGCARCGARRLATTLLAAAVAVPAAVWAAEPALTRYRGLSGLASALFALLAVSVLRTERAARPRLAFAAGLALAGFAAKLAWELATAVPVFVGPGAGFVAVPLAHLVGAACGVIGAYCASSRTAKASGSARSSGTGTSGVIPTTSRAPAGSWRVRV